MECLKAHNFFPTLLSLLTDACNAHLKNFSELSEKAQGAKKFISDMIEQLHTSEKKCEVTEKLMVSFMWLDIHYVCYYFQGCYCKRDLYISYQNHYTLFKSKKF